MQPTAPDSTTLVLLSYNEREALEKLIPLIPLVLFDAVLAILASLGVTKCLVSEPPTLRSFALLAILLGGVSVINGLKMQQQFTRTVALGYPSFSRAMQFLHAQTSLDAVLVGANYPRIHWYTDRRTIDFPDESELRSVLERSEWVIVTNFERSQRHYVEL